MHMQSSCETSAKYLQDLLDEFHLLSTDDEFVWSESLCRRMEGWDKVTENHRQAALKRWGKNAEQMQGTCGADARHMQEQGNKEHNRRKHRNRAVSIAQMEHKQRIKDAVQQDMAQIAKEFDNETD